MYGTTSLIQVVHDQHNLCNHCSISTMHCMKCPLRVTQFGSTRSYNFSQYNAQCCVPFSTFDKSHNHTVQITTLQVSILNVATSRNTYSFNNCSQRHKTCNLLEAYESVCALQVHTESSTCVEQSNESG